MYCVYSESRKGREGTKKMGTKRHMNKKSIIDERCNIINMQVTPKLVHEIIRNNTE